MDIQNLVVRRSSQERKKPERYSPLEFHLYFTLSTIEDDSRTVKEAINLLEGKLWKKPMEEEMESLIKNDTWDLVKLPNGRNTIGSKLVFKRKTNAVNQVEKFKVRSISKGYSQVKGVNFSEIFSLIAKLTSIRLLVSKASRFDLEIEKMDVKTTFLQGDLK